MSKDILQVGPLFWGCISRVERFCRKFDDQLKKNRFVAGDRFTVADITALCSFDFVKAVGIGVPDDYSSITRWRCKRSAGGESEPLMVLSLSATQTWIIYLFVFVSVGSRVRNVPAIMVSGLRPANYSLQSTAGSPKASTRAI